MASNTIQVKAKGYSNANAYTFKIDAYETGNVSGNSREIAATLSCYAVNPGGYQSFSSPRAYIITDGTIQSTATVKNIWPRKTWVTLTSWTGYLAAGQSHTITGRYNSNTNSYNYLPASGNNDVSVTLSLAATSVWNNINAYMPNGTTEAGLLFDLTTSDGSSWTNLYDQPADFSKPIGTTATISNIRPNAEGIHYTTNSVTGNGASSFSWTFAEGYVINMYSAWNDHTVTIYADDGIDDITNPAWSWTGRYKQGVVTFDNQLNISTTTKTGYHWLNYSGDISSTDQSYTFTIRDKDYNIYANTAPNTYTVKYNSNGGTGTTADSNHTYNVTSKLTANSFTRVGHSFLGWSTNAADTTPEYEDRADVVNLTSANGATVNLYAIWKENHSIIRTKKDGSWVSGKGYYKKNGNWLKIRAIYVKKNGSWIKEKSE